MIFYTVPHWLINQVTHNAFQSTWNSYLPLQYHRQHQKLTVQILKLYSLSEFIYTAFYTDQLQFKLKPDHP